ncbi:hypothetical protein SAMN05877842_1124 [Ureibacillus acetophenoni]|uniref:Uncharacterized protein n=1 Tax=Ureibacillus acetophenoni TaxID=614649 RepID=A0A285UK53_9BACL|nr:hypothetical protein SAMN05877842_1124 [Ureibacillus acetophenoni]
MLFRTKQDRYQNQRSIFSEKYENVGITLTDT